MSIDVTKMIEPAKQLAQPIVATLSDTWAAVIGDRVAAWRLQNAAALQLKVNEEVGKLGLQLDRSKIPERYAFSWFEEATKQDEPEIQELFARLLARAAAGDEDALDRRHLEILTRMTPMDAKVMEWLFREGGYPPKYPSLKEYEAWKRLREELGERSSMALEHLLTLGVFERQFAIKRDGYVSKQWVESGTTMRSLVDEMESVLAIDCELSVTSRGMSLFVGCMPTDPA